MNVFSKSHNTTSFRNTAILTMSVIVLPLFIVVVLFDVYTVWQQKTAVHNSRYSTLSAYQAQFENTLRVTEDFLTDTVVNSMDFASIIYARTKTDAYVASQAVGVPCKVQLKANELLGSFCTYSKAFDYYRISYTGSYPQSDLAVLRAAVMAAAEAGSSAAGWIPLSFSDRTVLLNTYVRNQTVFAAMIDPARQSYSVLGENNLIFYIMQDGTPYACNIAFHADAIPLPGKDTGVTFQADNGRKYDLTFLPLSRENGYIVYATPSVSLLKMLNFTQRVLLAITLGLLISIPLCWLSLRQFILEPLNTLTQTTQAIQNGDTQIRVPQESRIQEVNDISGTVNTMLDIIRQQKIDFYEQKLETQQAQLQYLHMQIRPHFFLNCLNMIYSMAGEKKYADIQELILDLSTYLRSTFKNSFKPVSLEEEIRSVNSYIRIQQIGTELPPQLDFEIDADISQASIPPLSILTFVENSIKHSSLIDTPLEIRIKCRKLASEDGGYLNITVTDNSAGFPAEILKTLNGPANEVYNDYHVGIANLKQRLRLLYGEKATLYFRNLAGGACAELFLPIHANISGGDLQ